MRLLWTMLVAGAVGACTDSTFMEKSPIKKKSGKLLTIEEPAEEECVPEAANDGTTVEDKVETPSQNEEPVLDDVAQNEEEKGGGLELGPLPGQGAAEDSGKGAEAEETVDDGISTEDEIETTVEKCKVPADPVADEAIEADEGEGVEGSEGGAISEDGVLN